MNNTDIDSGWLYELVDSFLVEAKDQNGNERSLERLNQDRHLFVGAVTAHITKAVAEAYDKGLADGRNHERLENSIADELNGDTIHKGA